MRHLMSIRILFSLFLAHAAGNAFACQKQDWKDFSTVSFTTDSAGRVTLTRFTDGIYAKIAGQQGIKEMYRLNGGATLYRGLSAAEENGASPFFMLDMPVCMEGATIAASGSVEFSALGPIPRDTVISDWSIEWESAGLRLGKMTRMVGTIRDLEKLPPEGAKK